MLFPDVRLYAVSVLLEWEGLVTGGLLVAALTLWERFVVKRQVNLATSAFVFLIGGFLGSSFQVWSDEHQVRNQLQDRLMNGRPNIVGVIFTPHLTGDSEPSRVIFHVSKKVYHPTVYFVFSGKINSADFSEVTINSKQDIISGNIFRLEFDYPELIPGRAYEVKVKSEEDVTLVAIIPQFADLQSTTQ